MSFVVFAMPRCRTKWLSAYLSYGGYVCGHEELRHCRSMDDVQSWFRQPLAGTVETAAAPFWRLLERVAPKAAVVTVRRDPTAVAASLTRCGVRFDERVMLPLLRRMAAKLDQIERRLPNVLRVSFDSLGHEAVCAEVFEHCTRLDHDATWWAAMAPLNLQVSMPDMLRYLKAYDRQIERLRLTARHEMLRAFRVTEPSLDGVTFQRESLRDLLNDGTRLLADESVGVGEAPNVWCGMNLPLLDRLEQRGLLHIYTARCNARMFGYIATAIGESFYMTGQSEAEHVGFFADDEWPGLGRKLLSAAIDDLRRIGCDRLLLTQPTGTRAGVLYRRLGARETGQRYVLELN